MSMSMCMSYEYELGMRCWTKCISMVIAEHESLDDNDVERNADLYILNHEVAQS